LGDTRGKDLKRNEDGGDCQTPSFKNCISCYFSHGGKTGPHREEGKRGIIRSLEKGRKKDRYTQRTQTEMQEDRVPMQEASLGILALWETTRKNAGRPEYH